MSRSAPGAWSEDFEADAEEPRQLGEADDRAFGRYILCWELASGGMGTVFLARDVRPGGFDRPVALKRIHPHLSSKQHLVDMFLDEARIQSLVNHPNVCTVYDFGEVDGTWYMAMEYLMGESLGAVMARLSRMKERLDDPAWHAFATRIAADSCEGLHGAHELKDAQRRPLDVVHRDVSPQNLFVTYDGAVKVIDFGVAHARHRLHQTKQGSVKGKYAYMAPEQFEGAAVDRRADVWSLGVCLWEMLTGERLFREPTEMETLLAIRQRVVRPPSTVRPAIPAALDAVCMRALARDADERYPSARAMARDLTAFLRAQPCSAELADVGEFMQRMFGDRHSKVAEIVKTVLAPSPMLRSYTRARTPSGGSPSGSVGGAAPSVAGGAARLGEGTASIVTPGGPPTPRLGEGTASVIVAAASGAGHTPVLDEADLVDVLTPGSPTPIVAGPAASVPPPPPRRPRRLLMAAVLGAVTSASLLGALLAVLWTSPEPAAPAPPPAASSAPETAPPTPAPVPPPAAVRLPPALPAPAPVAAPLLEPEPARREPPRSATKRPPREEPVAPPPPSAPATTAEPAREAAPEVARTGTVNVSTPGGWADVFHRGRRLGRTPRRATLPEGRQTLELRPFGRLPAEHRTVDVPAGGVVRLSVPLTR